MYDISLYKKKNKHRASTNLRKKSYAREGWVVRSGEKGRSVGQYISQIPLVYPRISSDQQIHFLTI